MSGGGIDVECVGGPLCGARLAVALQPAEQRVYLIRRQRRSGGGHDVFAYEWADRGTGNGKRWVLEFLRHVGVQGGAA